MDTHPFSIAKGQAHKAQQKGSCASDDKRHTPALPCDCTPDAQTLAEVWAGRARMARARLDGRRMIARRDELIGELGVDGKVHENVIRRYYIETDPDKILDDIDREALRKEGLL